MATPKILLFYIFTPLPDPEAVRLWQWELCASLGLRGRILLSPDGLNGTVGGDLPAIKMYIRKTREYPAFRDINFKWSEGTGLNESGHSLDFPKMMVKVREEIVSFGAPGELRVDAGGVVGGGIKLAPAELNALVAERGDDVVFFDGRNNFEAEIGHFPDAIVPDVSNTREFVAELDSGKYDHLKGKPVVTYCTGGIRCEVLSTLMKSRGFGEVYQLDGGIVRYGEEFGNGGLWSGSLYVFDQRMAIDFAEGADVLGVCQNCAAPTINMPNCHDIDCRKMLLVCFSCAAAAPPSCQTHAYELSAALGIGSELAIG